VGHGYSQSCRVGGQLCDNTSVTTRVIVTGTGIPIPAPGRAGAGVLVGHDDVAIQIDCGRATTLRLAEAGVELSDLTALLLTHHHNDHVVGIADLLLTRWIQARSIHHCPPLPVHFPRGPLGDYLDQVLDIYAHDIEIRRESTGRTSEPHPEPLAFDVPGDEPQLVLQAGDMEIESFLVEHGVAKPAVGYRITSPDGVIVVSGDTRVCAAVASAARGADVLVHEVFHPAMLEQLGREPEWVLGMKSYHAEAGELGELAARAEVGHLVLTHMLPSPNGDEQKKAYADAVRAGGFAGLLTVADDLDVIELP